MHIVECDGCKAREFFTWAITKDSLDQGPEGWGWRNCLFTRHNGIRDSLILHACNIACARPAFLRIKTQFSTLEPKDRRSLEYSAWSGFRGASAADRDLFAKVPLAEGGNPPPKPAPKLKKDKWARVPAGPPMPAFEEPHIFWTTEGPVAPQAPVFSALVSEDAVTALENHIANTSAVGAGLLDEPEEGPTVT